MRVLGIDPGLTRCGFGVVDGAPGRPPTHDGGGRAADRPASLDTARRLVAIEAASRTGSPARPDAVAVERVFAQHNVQTVMGTAQAAGVAMLVAARHGLPVALHTPSEVKAAITGSGRAGKAQVAEMVTRILRLARAPRTPPTPPTPSPSPSATSGAGARRTGCAAGRARPTQRREAPDDRPAVSGTVAAVGPTSAVVEVGGLGILALCSPGTVAGLRVGQRATLFTSLVVREDSLTLFGFASADEREFFELLLTATGVGPKLAQAALAVLSPGRAPAGHRHREPRPALQGARDRPQGRPADRDRAQGQDRRGRPGRPSRRAGAGARPAGATRSPWDCRASAGRRGTPRPPATRSSRCARDDPAPGRRRC